MALGLPQWSITEARHGSMRQSKGLTSATSPDCNLGSVKINLCLRNQLPKVAKRRRGSSEHCRSVRRLTGSHVGSAETTSCPRGFYQQAGFIKYRKDLFERPARGGCHSDCSQYLGTLRQYPCEMPRRVDRNQTPASLFKPMQRLTKSTTPRGQIGQVALRDCGCEIRVGGLKGLTGIQKGDFCTDHVIHRQQRLAKVVFEMTEHAGLGLTAGGFVAVGPSWNVSFLPDVRLTASYVWR